MKLFLTMSLIETHKTRWDWETILNVLLNVPLNETHKTTRRGLMWLQIFWNSTKLQTLKVFSLSRLYTSLNFRQIALLFPDHGVWVWLNNNHLLYCPMWLHIFCKLVCNLHFADHLYNRHKLFHNLLFLFLILKKQINGDLVIFGVF